jgi:hypothetical protein
MKPFKLIHNVVFFCTFTFFIMAGLPGNLRAAVVTSFDEIDYWVGSGSNSAALVVAWNDGISPVSLAWGFHWDGIATGEQMFKAIAGATLGDVTATGADSRLSIYITSYSFGNAIDRIVYDGDGYDHDSAGFLSGGYWEYYCMGGTFDTPPDGNPNLYAGSSSYPGTGGSPDWISSWTGFSDRELSDGSWDGWSFAPDFVSQSIVAPVAAVPEPGILTLISIAGVLVISFRRRTRLLRS